MRVLTTRWHQIVLTGARTGNLQSPALRKSKLIYRARAPPPPQQQGCNEVSGPGLLASPWAANGSGNQARAQPSNNQHSGGGGTPCCGPCLLLFVFLSPFNASPRMQLRRTWFRRRGNGPGCGSVSTGLISLGLVALMDLLFHSNPPKTQTQHAAMSVFIGRPL